MSSSSRFSVSALRWQHREAQGPWHTLPGSCTLPISRPLKWKLSAWYTYWYHVFCPWWNWMDWLISEHQLAATCLNIISGIEAELQKVTQRNLQTLASRCSEAQTMTDPTQVRSQWLGMCHNWPLPKESCMPSPYVTLCIPLYLQLMIAERRMHHALVTEILTLADGATWYWQFFLVATSGTESVQGQEIRMYGQPLCIALHFSSSLINYSESNKMHDG